MTPIYQAQSWKVIRTNKPHKRTRKNFLIPLISLHIRKIQLHHTTPIFRGTSPPNTTYIFSALSLPAVSMQFLAHLRLAKWSLNYISYKHSRFVLPEYYPASRLRSARWLAIRLWIDLCVVHWLNIINHKTEGWDKQWRWDWLLLSTQMQHLRKWKID
mgnify:CR=1 FL=1